MDRSPPRLPLASIYIYSHHSHCILNAVISVRGYSTQTAICCKLYLYFKCTFGLACRFLEWVIPYLLISLSFFFLYIYLLPPPPPLFSVNYTVGVLLEIRCCALLGYKEVDPSGVLFGRVGSQKNREGERVRESFKNLDQKVSLGYRCTKMFDWCLLLKAAAFY